MSLANIYAELEKTEDGKKLLEELKGDIAKLNEESASERVKNKDLTKAIEESKDVIEFFKKTGMSIDEIKSKIETTDKALQEKTGLEKSLIELQGTVKTLIETNEKSEKERLKSVEDAKISELKATFEPLLVNGFKTLTPLVVGEYIKNGTIKMSDEGKPIFVKNGIPVDIKDGVEHIKAENKEMWNPVGGAGAGGTGDNVTQKKQDVPTFKDFGDILNSDPTELL